MKEFLETKNEIQSMIYLKNNKPRLYTYYILCILTFFIPAFIFNLKKNLKKYLYTEVDSIKNADYIFLDTGDDERIFLEVTKVNLRIYETLNFEDYFLIKYQNIIFYFDFETDCFMIFNSKFFNFLKKNVKDLKEIIQPISQKFYEEKFDFFGINNFRVEKISLINDIAGTFIQPLYMFYMFLALIFVFSNENGYLLVVGFSLIFMFTMKRTSYNNQIDKINKFSEKTPTITVLKREKKTSQKTLKNSQISSSKKNSIKNSKSKNSLKPYKIIKKQINSKYLTQGDIIEVENSQSLNFDCLILSGECLINQSTLTGEATPILKTEMDQEKLKIKNIIYSGSQIIELKTNKVYALVTSVGFNSFQGNMISCLCSKKTIGVTIKTDFIKVFSVFFSFFFFLLTLKYYVDLSNGDSIFFADVVFRYAQLFKDSFPIKAWLVLFITDITSNKSLDEQKINKITTNHILLAGRMKMICFDKTGTLTEDNMKFYSFYKKEENEKFIYKRVKNLKNEKEFEFNLVKETGDIRFFEIMGCCHSLMNLKDEIIGDPMEREMFNLTKFDLIQENIKNEEQEKQEEIETDIFKNHETSQKNSKLIIKPTKKFLEKFELEEDFTYEIKKYFHFEHDTKRMSVIISNPKEKDKFIFLLKGAPEVVKNLCKIESLPKDYNLRLERYNKKGYRILTGAYKVIDNLDSPISELEDNLNFCSFLIYENSLKKGVKESLQSLKKCGYKTCMITGDALMTAISVGYKSNMLDNNKKIHHCKFNLKTKEFVIDKTDREGLSHEKNPIESEEQSAFNLYNNSILSEEKKKIKSLVKRMISDCEINKNKIALDGNAISFLTEKFKENSQIRKKIFKHAIIYGRTNPFQKKLVVKELKSIYKPKNYYIGYVGDGANDGEALNEADVGFSVGNEFSSLVAGYYTESDKIEGIHDLSVEGKFALKNSIDIGLYIVIYSFFRLCVIVLLSFFNYNMISADYWIRLINEFFIIFAMPYFLGSSKVKSIFMPEFSFLVKSMLFVIVFDILMIFCSVVVIILNLKFDEKYKDSKDIIDFDDKINNNDYFFIESKILVFLCFYTIPLIIWTFSTSYPFKKNLLTNIPLVIFSFFMSFFFFSMFFEENSIFSNYYLEYFKVKYIRWPYMEENFNWKVFYMICIFISILFLINKCFVLFILNRKGKYYQEKLIKRIKKIEQKKIKISTIM